MGRHDDTSLNLGISYAWHLRYLLIYILILMYISCLYFRIRWLGNPSIQKRNSGGCPKKYGVMLKLFLTALQPMFQR